MHGAEFSASCKRGCAHEGCSNLTVGLAFIVKDSNFIEIMKSNLGHLHNGILFGDEKEMSY